jgi:hypothetical protein
MVQDMVDKLGPRSCIRKQGAFQKHFRPQIKIWGVKWTTPVSPVLYHISYCPTQLSRNLSAISQQDKSRSVFRNS